MKTIGARDVAVGGGLSRYSGNMEDIDSIQSNILYLISPFIVELSYISTEEVAYSDISYCDTELGLMVTKPLFCFPISNLIIIFSWFQQHSLIHSLTVTLFGHSQGCHCNQLPLYLNVPMSWTPGGTWDLLG